ncbi:MAG: hypothetical protein HWN81_01985 [Candidatus Lokiarchaeota archaeon]|nr:hypothetical protein [Candidatus Lokiarchaeota archaeon]
MPPIYIYKHPELEEYTEVVQGMNDKHVYFDSEGLEWKRVFTIPNASIDSQIDPYSSKQFVESTANKKGSFGDMMDYSKEMSQKRAEANGGIDPVREKTFKDYSEKRNGAKHFDEIKSKGYESKNLKVDFSE